MALIGLRLNIGEVFDMKYLTGIYALNIENSLNTCGDWHTSALDWNKIELQESDNSMFKDWGIELNKRIPCHIELYAVANDLRAILDLMESGKTSWLKGFRNDFICTDEYNTEFFNKVAMLKGSKYWRSIDALMKREFMSQWECFKESKGLKEKKMNTNDISWMGFHKEIIIDFIQFLNAKTKKFILKGGTALMLCYGLERFSEDIDLDGFENIFRYIDGFMSIARNKYPYIEYRIAKDTQTVQRVMIHYGGAKPLKVEVSFRRSSVNDYMVTSINNILVYSIDELARLKTMAFNSRDKIRDLYDITFIYIRYKQYLSPNTIDNLRIAVEYKGIEQFDFIIKDQYDPLINNDILANQFLTMYYDLGLR